MDAGRCWSPRLGTGVVTDGGGFELSIVSVMLELDALLIMGESDLDSSVSIASEEKEDELFNVGVNLMIRSSSSSP